jgi:muconolactone D-isomerase
MLFLLKGEVKGATPLPQREFLEVAVKEWETIINYRQRGKVLAGGKLAGRKGGCAIFDVESLEELDILVSRLPMFPFVELEITPLTPPEHALEWLKRALAAVGAK